MKKIKDSDKVESVESYFERNHYEDMLITDMEIEPEDTQEEEHLRVDSF